MRLPLPFLLYTLALGLFAWAGWTVYDSLPLWSQEARKARSNKGIEAATDLLARGKGSGPAIVDWNYALPNWWPKFKDVNLIGKLPPKPLTPDEIANQQAPPEPVVDMTPLEDIIELVSLVYDGKGAGRGENSHVIIRYKPDAAVQPPEWWERENAPPSTGRTGSRDIVSRQIPRAGTTPTRVNRGNRGNRGRGPKTAPTKMPTAGAGSSLTGRAILQKLWVDDGGNVRRSSSLWPTFEHIRLVRVAPDAQSAFFVRVLPADKDGNVPEPKEEELLKTTMNLSQDVLRELRRLQGREGERSGPTSSAPSGPSSSAWRDVEETTRFGNEFHIGRKDEKSFRDTDDFFNSVHVDTYVSSSSKLRGLSVRSVSPEIAQRFGLQPGEVLIEVNGRKVESKAQAFSMVKKDYKRGVRAFNTKWLSNGQVVDRLYQAPDK